MKNVQEDKSYENAINYKILTKLKFQKNRDDEVHFDVLENIIFSRGSISKVFFLLNKWTSQFHSHGDIPEGSSIESGDSDETDDDESEDSNIDNINSLKMLKMNAKKNGIIKNPD